MTGNLRKSRSWTATGRDERADMEFKVTTYGSIRVIHLSGDFFLYAAPTIDESWEKMLETEPSVIAFDCKDLTFIDSAAIGTLVKFVSTSGKKDINVEFINVKEDVMKIFAACRLDTIFKITTRQDFCRRYDLPC